MPLAFDRLLRGLLLLPLHHLNHLEPEVLEEAQLHRADDDVREAALLRIWGVVRVGERTRASGGWEFCGGSVGSSGDGRVRRGVGVVRGTNLADFGDERGELGLRHGGFLRAGHREEHVADDVAHEAGAVLAGSR